MEILKNNKDEYCFAALTPLRKGRGAGVRESIQ